MSDQNYCCGNELKTIKTDVTMTQSEMLRCIFAIKKNNLLNFITVATYYLC